MSDAMLTLCGQVVNVYVQPGGTNKKTGEAYDPRDKVQLLGNIPMPDGSVKYDLVDLSTENGHLFEQAKGKTVRVPVGVFAMNRSVGYFIPKGARPVLVGPAEGRSDG